MDGVEAVYAPGEGDETIAVIVETNREVIVAMAGSDLGQAGPSGQRRGRQAELAARPASGLNLQTKRGAVATRHTTPQAAPHGQG